MTDHQGLGSSPSRRLEEVLRILGELQPALVQAGVAHLYVFGSVARGDDLSDSDVDLAFDIAPDADERFSLIDQSRLQRELSAALGQRVDLVERDWLRPNILKRAAADFVRVF